MSNKILVTFSSKNKNSQNDTDSDFKTSFTQARELNNVVSCKVQNVVFTNTVYNINENNNLFIYEKLGGTGILGVQVEPGQYSITELLTAIEAGMAANLDTVTASFSVNSKTSKISLVSSNFPLKLAKNYPIISLYSTLNEQLGLGDFADVPGYTTTYDFPNVFDISGLDVLTICSNVLTSHGSIDNFRDKNTGQSVRTRSDVIKTIPVTAAFGFKLNYENTNDFPDVVYDRPKSITSIDIQLRDRDGQIINTNGADVFICLEVEFLP
jgi:hypothetical protein